MKLEITVTAEVKKEIEVNIDLDDVIEKMNNINMAARWNYIAKILNSVSMDDINFLSDEQKKVINNYLLQQSRRFNY